MGLSLGSAPVLLLFCKLLQLKMSSTATLDDSSPTLCLYITGHDWDHYLLFAMTEINSGMYNSTLGDTTFQHKILYADPYALMVEGVAQDVFSSNYQSCHAFVGPAWTTQLGAIGEWAGIKKKPIVSGGATSPIFAQDNFGYVSRSIPSDLNVLEAFAQLIVEYKLSLINVVYANDEYGASVVQALTDLSEGRFDIQILRSFESTADVENINSVLDDLEASPTSVTFLGATVIQAADFLNAAGKRGMHDTHLWLSPQSVQVTEDLDPPSTGGIWGISYGEELTEESPLAQRYLAKDPTPHIEAQQYGFDDQYNTLTYWGSYAYDAVLAAAHGVVAASNRSNGEEVLKEIRSLRLNNTNTGVLEMDQHGDRVGARIPLFFVNSEGVSEQFGVYYDGTVDFLRDPLWPGGSTTQPELIREGYSCKPGTYWSDADQSCQACPSFGNITASNDKLEFEGVSKTLAIDTAGVTISNEGDFPVSIHLESSPAFISHNAGFLNDTQQHTLGIIEPSNSLPLEFTSSSENLSAGVAVGEIVLGVSDEGLYPGCVGDDIRLEAIVNVSPTAELNQLGELLSR
jgi:ABC-type branched-subunit amino acid transport system substrate-binding protein